MYSDPTLDIPPAIPGFHPRLKELWLEALARPEVDLKRQAAEAIARAHQTGLLGLETTVPDLSKELEDPELHPVAALAVARTLIVLDARDAAAVLHKRALADGLDMSLLVEPALLDWKYEPVRETWRKRIANPGAGRLLIVLAVRGLGTLGDAESAERLRALALDPAQPTSVRLEAARSLGRVQSQGLEEDAAKLAADKSPTARFNRLATASILSSSSSDRAKTILLELVGDTDPIVVAAAAERLLEIDAALLLPKIDQMVSIGDARVRRAAVKALEAAADVSAVEKLGRMLDDRNPAVGGAASSALFRLARTPALQEKVRSVAAESVAAPGWRSAQQGARLTGALGEKSAAEKLVPLLNHDRAEVGVAAAWALRILAVPETLPAMLKTAQNRTAQLRQSGAQFPRKLYDDQVIELLQAMGQMKYAPADEVLRRYIPETSRYSANARAAAIWALGHIHADKPDEKLAAALMDRLSDVISPGPEDDRVRRMSAVSLGRMKAENAVPTLRKFYAVGENANRTVGYACAWSLRRLLSEEIADPKTPTVAQRGWFLEPVE